MDSSFFNNVSASFIFIPITSLNFIMLWKSNKDSFNESVVFLIESYSALYLWAYLVSSSNCWICSVSSSLISLLVVFAILRRFAWCLVSSSSMRAFLICLSDTSFSIFLLLILYSVSSNLVAFLISSVRLPFELSSLF